jgi:endonuclease I
MIIKLGDKMTIKDYVIKHKKWSIVLLGLSLILFLNGIYFVDVSWWWMMILIIPGIGIVLSLYKSELETNAILKRKISLILGWIVFYSLVFNLFAIFITAWWLFGILISIALSLLWGRTIDNQNDLILSGNEKKLISYLISAICILGISFYCIPSYIANSHRNPQEQFSSNYSNSAVSSYSIYGELGDTNREHVIARSWYETENNYVNDYVNVIWSNQTANSERSNLMFGKVKPTNETAVYSEGVIVGYNNNKYFMPTDEFKGDVARIVLYMYATYKNDQLDTSYINLALMKQWSRQDPVDQRERSRNNLIEDLYGYSNRFVKSQWLVGFVI